MAGISHLFEQYYGLDYLCAICIVAGMHTLANQRRAGFAYLAGGAVLGLVFAVVADSPPFVLMNAVVFVLNVKGYLNWKE
jgi:hypothetical protein